MDYACPRCGAHHLNCGCRAVPSMARAGDRLGPLLLGPSGYACYTCGAPALHDFSVHAYHACTEAHLAKQSGGRYPLRPTLQPAERPGLPQAAASGPAS